MSAALAGMLLLPTLSGCVPAAPVREAVLAPGQSITATNKFGTVTISYVSPIKREYEWDGRRRIVKMIPRPEPFQGRLGLYEPADAWFFETRTRLVVDEYVRHFGNYAQIYAVLYSGSAVMDWVYTPDGLVVGFGRVPERNQINVGVWQILLHGTKPSGLRGARAQALHLTAR